MRNFLVMSLLLVDLAACSRTPTSPLPPPISGIRIGTPIDEALAELYKDSELRDKISVAHFLLPTTKLPPTQAEAVAVLNSIRSNSPSPAFTTNLVMATKRYERVEIHSDKEGDLPPGNWTDLNASPLLAVEDGCGRASSPKSRSSRC